MTTPRSEDRKCIRFGTHVDCDPRCMLTCVVTPHPEAGLRAALVKGQRDAEAGYKRAQERAVEAYHHGRMVAYMDAIEAHDAALTTPPDPLETK